MADPSDNPSPGGVTPTDPSGWVIVKIICTGGRDGARHRRRLIATFEGEPVSSEPGLHRWHERTTRERTLLDFARINAAGHVVDDPRARDGIDHETQVFGCPTCRRRVPFRLENLRRHLDQLARASDTTAALIVDIGVL